RPFLLLPPGTGTPALRGRPVPIMPFVVTVTPPTLRSFLDLRIQRASDRVPGRGRRCRRDGDGRLTRAREPPADLAVEVAGRGGPPPPPCPGRARALAAPPSPPAPPGASRAAPRCAPARRGSRGRSRRDRSGRGRRSAAPHAAPRQAARSPPLASRPLPTRLPETPPRRARPRPPRARGARDRGDSGRRDARPFQGRAARGP